MGESTAISWCDHTFNGWVGCEKISPGCKNCYAADSTPARVSKSRGLPLWGPDSSRHVTSVSNWREPLKWNARAERACVRAKVFAHSLSDVFEDRRDLDEPRAWLFELIERTPWLDWLLVTKRTDRILELVPAHWRTAFLRNVWIGTTVENNEQARARIPHLRPIPAVVKFLSCEPLLEGLRLFGVDEDYGTGYEYDVDAQAAVDWVIVGGESGPHARECEVEWIRSIVRQCREAGVTPFVKQVGSLVRVADDDFSEWGTYTRFGECDHTLLKTEHPKGGDPSQWPTDLRVQEFPDIVALEEDGL